MVLVVQKFGGTSVEDARAMARVIAIVREKGITRRTRPLVVSSACSGVTDTLIRTSEAALKPDVGDALHLVDQLEARHARIARELIEDTTEIERVQAALHAIWEEVRTLARGVNLLRELTPRSRDQFQSVGERCSTLILHAGLAERLQPEGIAAHYYDARTFFATSADFTSARPMMPEIRSRMKKISAALSRGAVGVTQGFVGATLDGQVTTIGRGGSDVSAAIQGVAIGASEIQIWTDVAGIMTCDPRIAPAASTIETISYRDASELAFFGAKVLHPETIWPAIEKGIPVRILSSKDPENNGTIILEEFASDIPITGIALKRGIVLSRIVARGAHLDSSVQQAVSDAFVEAGVTPLAVSLSQDSALYVLDDTQAISRLRAALQHSAEISIERERAMITLVGSGLKYGAGIASRIFRSLGRTNCEMVSYGGSETAVSVVVEESVANRVVKKLHAEFFE